MVNVYIPASQAEAASPYAGGSGQQQPGQTAAAADAANTVGRENREKVGLGSGYGGRSSVELDEINRQTQLQQQQEQQRQQDQRQQEQQSGTARVVKYQGWEADQDAMVDRPNYDIVAIEQAISSRPRYTDPSMLGDSLTRDAVNRGENVGRVLELQRQAAEKTPGTRDDRFYQNELDKWNANRIEASSGEHAFKKQSTNPALWTANTRENVGDIALAMEKAGNQKDFTSKTYGFNQNVGTVIGLLPGGQGLQETGWRVAKTDAPANVNFLPAIDYSISQEGKYGVYGNLHGGRPDPFTPTPLPDANRNAMATPISAIGEAGYKRPFLSSSNVQTEVIPPTGEIDLFGNKIVIPGLAFFQQPTIKTTGTFLPKTVATPFAAAFGDNFQFKAATDINKLDAAPWVPSKGEVAVGSPIVSAPVVVGSPIITTRFNSQTGETETITEQKYNQDISQKYETWDMSKQTVTPTVTSFTAGKSGLDKLNEQVSDKYIKPYTPTPEEATRSGYAFLHVGKLVEGKGRVITDADIATFEKNSPYGSAGVKFFTEGFYGGARDKPVTAAVSYGAGAVLGGVFRVVGTGFEAVAPTITRVAGPTVTKAISFTGGKVAPVVLTGIYGVDVAARSTEGFSNYQPSVVSKNLGTIASTEVMPAIAGFNTVYGFGRATPVQERSTFFQQEPIRYPNGYGRGTEVRSNILMAQELQMKPEVKSLDLTNLLPEANLETGRYSAFQRPENVATLAEQAMVMRQFQLTPQEIRMAKMQGLTLNDIMGIRALEAPMMTAEVQPVKVYNVQQMFSPEPLTISMLETPQTKQVSGLYGNQQMIGNNVVQSLIRTQESVNYQDVIPAVMTMNYGMVGTTQIIGSNVIQQLARNQVSKQDQRTLPALVSWQGSVVTPKQDTKSRQAIMPDLITGTIPSPFSGIKTTSTGVPKTTYTNEPWRETTWGKTPVPIIPFLPLFGGGGSGTGKKRRGRKFTEFFPQGILAGVQAGYKLNSRQSQPKIRMPKVPKIPKQSRRKGR